MVPISLCLLIHTAPITTLFPYTTLFRSQVGDLGRVGVTREEIEPIERLRILADPRPRHVEPADRQPVPREPLGEPRSEEHTSELQSPCNLVCRLLLEKKTALRYTCDLEI